MHDSHTPEGPRLGLSHQEHRALRAILGALGVLGGYSQMGRDATALSLLGERLLAFLRRRPLESRPLP